MPQQDPDGLLPQQVITYTDPRGNTIIYATGYRYEQVGSAVLDCEAKHGKPVGVANAQAPLPR
ncbi:MAG TPA: hypothetical protein VN213_13535 [Solirubrobacteraceae bacterium]|nr:hypothetical protein [Solirubrobacteraceae bacterium]